MYDTVQNDPKATAALRLSRVWYGHVSACVMHLAQSVVLGALGPQNAVYDSPAFITYGGFPNTLLAPSVHVTGSVPVHWFPFIFTMLAALHHLSAAAWWDSYSVDVSQGRGWMAWLEYSASAPIMNVAIACLCGVTEVGTLVAVAGLTCATMYFGWAAEAFASTTPLSENARNDPLSNAQCAYCAGFVPFALAWAAIGFSFHYTRGNAPSFVLAIFFTMLVLELSFAGNLWIYLSRLTPKRPVNADAAIDNEWGKIILSFVAKTALAWLVYGGVNARSP
jgi:hypothetical protein